METNQKVVETAAEELRMRKTGCETHQPQGVTLRREDVDVRRITETEKFGD